MCSLEGCDRYDAIPREWLPRECFARGLSCTGRGRRGFATIFGSELGRHPLQRFGGSPPILKIPKHAQTGLEEAARPRGLACEERVVSELHGCARPEVP